MLVINLVSLLKRTLRLESNISKDKIDKPTQEIFLGLYVLCSGSDKLAICKIKDSIIKQKYI